MAEDFSSTPSARSAFQSTQWSLVLRAGSTASDESRRALDELCRAYWYPLYAYVRRRGYSQHDALDLTQGFFTYQLENSGIATVHPERGRFRAFLLASLKNFIRNHWRHASAEKRGGKVQTFSIDDDSFEQKYQAQLARDNDPEEQFDRDWVESLLIEKLRADYERAQHAELFEALHPYLIADGDRLPQAVIAEKLCLSISAVKMSVHRIRAQYAKQVRSEIANTLHNPEDVEDELNRLIAIVRH